MDKAYLKRALFTVIAVVISVALILYVGYHIRRFFTKEVATVPTREAEREFTFRTDGYIFREEQTIPAAAGGSAVPEIADGTHVHSGETVASVFSVSDPQARARLDALSSQLSLFEELAATNRGAKDAAATDQRIYAIMTQIKSLSAKNDYSGVAQLSSELIARMNERVAASGASGSFSELISSVRQQIAGERAALGSVLATVNAPRAGWYYSQADGFEGIFTPSALDTLTHESFDSLISQESADVSGCAGKLATDFKWYLALRIDAAAAASLKEGDVCPVAFAYNGGTKLPMTVEQVISATGRRDVILVLSSGELLPGFSFIRCQTVDVTTETLTGFSVPRSAVRLVDGVMGVYVFDGVYANFRRIEVLREYEDTFLVKTNGQIAAEKTAETGDGPEAPDDGEFHAEFAPYLAQNDLIVVEGKGLYEGKMIS